MVRGYDDSNDEIFFEGNPPPVVTWWRENFLLDNQYNVSNGISKNILEIPALTRNDLMATLTCTASNNNISYPVSSSVIIDLNCEYRFPCSRFSGRNELRVCNLEMSVRRVLLGVRCESRGSGFRHLRWVRAGLVMNRRPASYRWPN